jgi:CheY-like chemotaxis protein
MDVEMPEMDGLEATRLLRASGSEWLNGSIPVIAMTARALCGDREVCLAAGMNDYIAKPVTPASLARLIEKWVVAKPGSGPNKNQKAIQTASAVQIGNGRTPAVFNHSDLLERLMGDGFLARTVVRGFRAEIPQQLDALQGCLGVRDLKGAEHHVRTIKAAANDIGAERLAGLALELERAWRAGDASSLRAGFSKLRSEVDEVNVAVEASGLLETGTAGSICRREKQKR